LENPINTEKKVSESVQKVSGQFTLLVVWMKISNFETKTMAYSQEEINDSFNLILKDIEVFGYSLRKSLSTGLKMPSTSTFYEWLENDEEKAKRYARACKIREEIKYEEILEIADNDDGMYIDEFGNRRIDNGFNQKKRLQIDARKWQLSKENPKKYGEKLDMTSGGDKIQPTELKVNIVRPTETDD